MGDTNLFQIKTTTDQNDLIRFLILTLSRQRVVQLYDSEVQPRLFLQIYILSVFSFTLLRSLGR